MAGVPARPGDVNLDRDRLAAAGFLARYREPTRSLYTLNLNQWFAWCADHGLAPLTASRAHIEVYARELEERRGNKPSTVANKLNTLSGFYKVATMDRLITDNPAEWLRKPSVPRQSTTTHLTRSELLAVLDKAQATSHQDHALLCILGLNGLRIGEALAVDVEHLSRVGGYRTVYVVREKGNKAGVVPLSPRTSWAIDTMLGSRVDGPLFKMRGGVRMDRKAADRVVKRIVRGAGITTKRITPHSFRHTFVTLGLDAGVPVRDMVNSMGYSDSRMVSYYDHGKDSLPRHATHMVSAYVEGS